MADAKHLGSWILTGSAQMSGWRPKAGFAIFEESGAFAAGDLEGEESGQWLSDGDQILTEDPSYGTVSSWQYSERDDSLVRALSDEETGFHGAGALIYTRAEAVGLEAVMARHLERLPGVGRAMGGRLAAAGVSLRSLRALTEVDAERLAVETGIAAATLMGLARAAQRL